MMLNNQTNENVIEYLPREFSGSKNSNRNLTLVTMAISQRTDNQMENILKARLVLDAILSRQNRHLILRRSNRRKRFLFKQTCLRISFMSLISLGFLLGFLICLPICNLFINFNYQCPLYTKINKYNPVESFSTETNQTSVALELTDVNWSPSSICIYCICIGIIEIGYCTISMFFFLMFNQKNLKESDYFLLSPWIMFTSIVLLLVLVCACMITRGFVDFCGNEFDCRVGQLYVWKKINSSYFYDYLIVSLVSSWMLFLVMLLIDVAILIRIVFIYRNYKHEMAN